MTHPVATVTWARLDLANPFRGGSPIPRGVRRNDPFLLFGEVAPDGAMV